MGWFAEQGQSAPGEPGASLIARAEAFQKDVDSMLSEVTRMSLPLQKSAFECCVRCFDSGNDSLDSIGECVKQCQVKPEKFGSAVQTELNQLQDALLACQQKCFNKYSSQSAARSDAVTAEMERCAVQCYDSNHGMLKDISTRLGKLYRNF